MMLEPTGPSSSQPKRLAVLLLGLLWLRFLTPLPLEVTSRLGLNRPNLDAFATASCLCLLAATQEERLKAIVQNSAARGRRFLPAQRITVRFGTFDDMLSQAKQMQDCSPVLIRFDPGKMNLGEISAVGGIPTLTFNSGANGLEWVMLHEMLHGYLRDPGLPRAPAAVLGFLVDVIGPHDARLALLLLLGRGGDWLALFALTALGTARFRRAVRRLFGRRRTKEKQ